MISPFPNQRLALVCFKTRVSLTAATHSAQPATQTHAHSYTPARADGAEVLAQRPRPLHPDGQTGLSQLGPVQPSSHSHFIAAAVWTQ